MENPSSSARGRTERSLVLDCCQPTPYPNQVCWTIRCILFRGIIRQILLRNCISSCDSGNGQRGRDAIPTAVYRNSTLPRRNESSTTTLENSCARIQSNVRSAIGIKRFYNEEQSVNGIQHPLTQPHSNPLQRRLRICRQCRNQNCRWLNLWSRRYFVNATVLIVLPFMELDRIAWTRMDLSCTLSCIGLHGS